MNAPFSDLCERLAKLLEETPAADFQKNSRAVAQAILARLNVVGRDEFDAHCEMLARAVERVQEMEERVGHLEADDVQPAQESAKPGIKARKPASKKATKPDKQ